MHYLALFLSVTGWLLFAIITVEHIVERVRERRKKRSRISLIRERIDAAINPRKDLL